MCCVTFSDAAGPKGPAVVVCLLLFLLVACGDDDTDRGTRAAGRDDLPRTPAVPREIVLDLPVDPDLAEFSGLTWWGDRLVLLPQYPKTFGEDGAGALLTIDRERLRRYVEGRDTSAIRPSTLPFDDGGLGTRVTGWDGYEAVATDGDRIFLSVECRTPEGWEGLIVRGRIEGDPPRVVVDPLFRTHLAGASGAPNFSEEALLVQGDEVWSVHELNGRRVNPAPVATRMNQQLEVLEPWPFPPIEYRITDATATDAERRFWVINQFWPGDAARVQALRDELVLIDRPGGRPVERLVALRALEGRVVIDTTQGLVELVTREDDVTRNWEGIARWDDTGFLLVTDRHPRTIFAYVERR